MGSEIVGGDGQANADETEHTGSAILFLEYQKAVEDASRPMMAGGSHSSHLQMNLAHFSLALV